MHINEDFQLEYLVYRDLMCCLSVPLLFLSTVLRTLHLWYQTTQFLGEQTNWNRECFSKLK